MNYVRNHIDFLNSLYSRLHQTSAFGVVPEFVNELLNCCDFIVLIAFSSLLITQLFVLRLFKLLEIAFVIRQFGVLEVDNLLDCRVKEISCVRHNNYSAIEILNVVFEPN